MRLKQTIYFVLGALLLAGCSYDDSDLQNQVNDLDARVTKLETTVSQINSNIAALMTAINAVENADFITSVTPLSDGTGYTITFSKSGTVTIYNGSDGKDGNDGADGADGSTPTISVVQDSDGIYYWTVNGEYLLDASGNKVPATEHTTPIIKIDDDNNFEISYDNGTTWEVIGSAGAKVDGVVFTSVVDGEDDVTFTLSDGTTIVIPKGNTFALVIEESSYVMSDGSYVLIPYMVSNADDGTVVDCIASEGYTAVVTASSTSAGSIRVIAPNPLVDGKVFVIAVNSKGATSAKILYFEGGVLTVVADASTVPAAGGTVAVSVTTNVEYTVIIPDEAVSWISYSETKATHTDNLTFTVAANTSTEVRSAEIVVMDVAGTLIQTFTIAQAAASSSSEEASNRADFETFNGGEASTTFGTYTTTAGWVLTNGRIIGTSTWSSIPDLMPEITGNINNVGTLTSPTLTGGCGTLSFNYGTVGLVSDKTVSFKIEILDGNGEVVATKEVTNTSAVKKTEYSDSWEVNVSGDFSIVFTNLCPGQKTANARNLVGFYNVTWTNYPS